MSKNTPSEATEAPLEPEDHKVFTTLMFTIGSASVVFVGSLAAMVLKKTAILTCQNLGHAIETKGKVWAPSKFRDFRSDKI